MPIVSLGKNRFSPSGLRARMREIAAQMEHEKTLPQFTDADYFGINLRITAENDIAKFIERRRVMSVHGKQWAEELKPKIIVAS